MEIKGGSHGIQWKRADAINAQRVCFLTSAQAFSLRALMGKMRIGGTGDMSVMTETTNKALVLVAFDTLFNKRDYAAATQYWSPNYVQHSAHIPLVVMVCSLSSARFPYC